jgi:hypothetical protein
MITSSLESYFVAWAGVRVLLYQPRMWGECGAVCVMRNGRGNRSSLRKSAQGHIVYHKTHKTWPGIGPGPSQWEAGHYRLSYGTELFLTYTRNLCWTRHFSFGRLHAHDKVPSRTSVRHTLCRQPHGRKIPCLAGSRLKVEESSTFLLLTRRSTSQKTHPHFRSGRNDVLDNIGDSVWGWGFQKRQTFHYTEQTCESKMNCPRS